MYLTSFTVNGFRSLMRVEDIPISSPTILAGHNDSGKTALLGALAFLLDQYSAEDEDHAYLVGNTGDRSPEIVVEGMFQTDDWERKNLQLPATARIRRVCSADSRWEHWAPVPADARLRDLSRYSSPELGEFVKEFGLKPATARKPDRLAALQAYARDHSDGEDWCPLPKQVKDRLPRLLMFDGASSADSAVKVALSSRFTAHTKDPELQGKLTDLEDEIRERLRTESKSLRDHIKRRCPDIAEVVVEPEVSFNQALRGTRIHITRGTGGGPVDLRKSGLGSDRRISLAIWEWTSDLLSDQVTEEVVGAEDQPKPVQTIVVYDEPDTHLDYRHQRKLMDLVREQCAIEHVNVVVATHSMNLIDDVDIADVVHLKLEAGHTTVERLGTETHDDIDRFLGKIAASVGLRNTVLLHERYFLAVEGDTEQQAVPHLFRTSQGKSLQSAGIALWSCDNNEGALHLGSYLASHDRNVLVMVDADSRSQKIFKDGFLDKTFGVHAKRIVTFVGEPDGFRELEELFPNEIWARTANERWPRETPWTEDDFEEHRGRKFSGQVQQMLQTQSSRGPGGKPAMMVGLALSLRTPDEVPRQLREIFQELADSAGQ